MRLPSDQLNKLISAFKETTAGMKTPSSVMTVEDSALMMPPPPLPLSTQKRNADHSSDISMHAGCLHFPTCTTEDEKGHITHSSPSASANKGKDGSSPLFKRKFWDVV